MKKVVSLILLALLIVTTIPLASACNSPQTAPGYPYQGGHMGPG